MRWRALYGGTEFGQQELEGVLVEAHKDALWSLSEIDALRLKSSSARYRENHHRAGSTRKQRRRRGCLRGDRRRGDGLW